MARMAVPIMNTEMHRKRGTKKNGRGNEKQKEHRNKHLMLAENKKLKIWVTPLENTEVSCTNPIYNTLFQHDGQNTSIKRHCS